MQVLQVYRDYFTRVPGGIERHVHQLAHGLRRISSTESDVLVASRSRRSHSDLDGPVNVHSLRELTRWQGLSISPEMVRWLNRSRYDLMHLHSPYPMGELAMRLTTNRCPKIATYHADLDRGARLMPAYRRFLWWTYERCDRVLTSNEEMITASPVLARLHDVRPEAISVVPFGIDTDWFSPGPTSRSDALREAWGPGPIVLFLGRLRYYKGLHLIVRAMKDVEAKLVIVGTGPMRDRIVPMAKGFLGDRFVYVHRAPDDELPDFYRAADLFCLPSTSRAEAFGLAALEAMACGIPVVTTDLGTGTSVVNQNDRTGFVVRPRDVRQLAEAIEQLLADEGRRKTYGNNARHRAVEHFGLNAMLEGMLAVYDDVT